MASDISMNFDYGDSVEILGEDALLRFGIHQGSVCGFRTLDGAQAILLGLEEGTRLVLIEAADGTAAEVPAFLLRRLE